MTRIRLSGLSSPLEFIDCPDVAEHLVSILRGWIVETCDAADSAEPLVRITRTKGSYSWRKALLPTPHDWRKLPPHTVIAVVCHLHHELVDWLVIEKPGYLCMHCASVEMGGGLVLLLGRGKAGKSTLTSELAAAGHRLFGDDVLLLDHLHGVAFGLLPRLRLPLPQAMSDQAREFAAGRAGLSSSKYQYVDMRPGELAPFGERAPIAGLVILDRAGSAAANMDPVSQGDMLKALILQNCLDAIPVKSTFDRLHELTGQALRFRLRYSAGADAVRLLIEAFAAPGSTTKAG